MLICSRFNQWEACDFLKTHLNLKPCQARDDERVTREIWCRVNLLIIRRNTNPACCPYILRAPLQEYMSQVWWLVRMRLQLIRLNLWAILRHAFEMQINLIGAISVCFKICTPVYVQYLCRISNDIGNPVSPVTMSCATCVGAVSESGNPSPRII